MIGKDIFAILSHIRRTNKVISKGLECFTSIPHTLTYLLFRNVNFLIFLHCAKSFGIAGYNSK